MGAFAAFYDRTAPMIFGLARSGSADLGAATDVAERAYLRLWREAPHFVPDSQCAVGTLLAVLRRELRASPSTPRDVRVSA